MEGTFPTSDPSRLLYHIVYIVTVCCIMELFLFVDALAVSLVAVGTVSQLTLSDMSFATQEAAVICWRAFLSKEITRQLQQLLVFVQAESQKRFDAFVRGLVKVDLTVAAILSGTAADRVAGGTAQQVAEKAATLQRQGTYLSGMLPLSS